MWSMSARERGASITAGWYVSLPCALPLPTNRRLNPHVLVLVVLLAALEVCASTASLDASCCLCSAILAEAGPMRSWTRNLRLSSLRHSWVSHAAKYYTRPVCPTWTRVWLVAQAW